MVLTSAAISLSILVGIVAPIHHFYVKPTLQVLGLNREVDPVGNSNCTRIPQIQACEKIVLHQPTGVLYLACSTPSSRTQWLPAAERLNLTGRSSTDFVATYDPNTRQVHRLQTTNFPSSRGLSLHGMDVVASSKDPNTLFIYLVNHRAPIGKDPRLVGADSVIEIFETKIGSGLLVHRMTIEDSSVIISPNDVAGSSDGQSFYFTNDHGSKVGTARGLVEFLNPASSVGYCHVRDGCKMAITKMFSNNGIVWAKNDTFFVASSLAPKLTVLKRKNDNTLVVTDTVQTDRGMDNLSMDNQGALWAVGFPKIITIFQHVANPTVLSPSSALRLTASTGLDTFQGGEFQLDKVFEDDGRMASGSTSVAYDTKRGHLYLHGLAASWLTVCKI